MGTLKLGKKEYPPKCFPPCNRWNLWVHIIITTTTTHFRTREMRIIWFIYLILIFCLSVDFLVCILFWWWGVQRWDMDGEKMATISHIIWYMSLHTPMISTYIWTMRRVCFPRDVLTYRKRSETEGQFESISSFCFFFEVLTSQCRSCSESNEATIQLMGRSHVKHIIGAKCIIIMYVQYGNIRLWCVIVCVIAGIITIL